MDQSSKGEKLWRAVGEWAGGMVCIVVANFAYSKVNPSYHNPFFGDPVGMVVWLSVPTVWYWCWGRGRRYIQRIE